MSDKNRYLYIAMMLFITEVFIALCVRDSVIRPYGGDFLVVIFLYCLVRAMINASVWKAALGVLLLAFVMETAQYFNIIGIIGLAKYKVARVVLGTSSEWGDMLAYALGIAVVLVFENRKRIIVL